jgi:hypothetical protein
VRPKPALPKYHIVDQPTQRKKRSCLFEIATVFVRLDHIASVIVNANHSIMKSALSLFIEPRLTLRSP